MSREHREGKVLSNENAAHLKTAYQHLAALLAGADDDAGPQGDLADLPGERARTGRSVMVDRRGAETRG